MVLSKVAAAGLPAIASICARFPVMAASSAGLKSATRTLSKGGTPPAGPGHGASSSLFTGRGGAWKRGNDLLSIVRDSDRSGRRFKCRAPNLAQLVAGFLIGLRLHYSVALPLQRQVMQHGAIVDVSLLEPLRGRRINDRDGRQAFE